MFRQYKNIFINFVAKIHIFFLTAIFFIFYSYDINGTYENMFLSFCHYGLELQSIENKGMLKQVLYDNGGF